VQPAVAYCPPCQEDGSRSYHLGDQKKSAEDPLSGSAAALLNAISDLTEAQRKSIICPLLLFAGKTADIVVWWRLRYSKRTSP
jgi:hypothetical protein